jgi:hypothetical protein
MINVSLGQGQIANNVFGNNVFINCGSAPIANLDQVAAANVYNNYTDMVLTTPKAGMTVAVAPAKLVRNTANDFRPDDAGVLIGAASQSAIDTLDIYSNTRGGSPDVGAAQGTVVNLLPQVVITTQDVNAQKVTLSGTTRYAPTSGVATMLPDATNPNGAVQQGPTNVILGSGTFSIEWNNVPPGNYQIPKITLTNPSGYNRTQSGGEVVNILTVSGQIIASEPAPTVGNAPVASVADGAFDNSTYSLTGAIDTQGDANGVVNVYIDFADGRPSIGPVKANIIGKGWGAQFAGLTGKFTPRVVAVANGKTAPAVTGKERKVVKMQGAFNLPTP